MSVPNIVDDGVFTAEAQNGGWTISNPLADKGDFYHIRADRKVRIDVSSFYPGQRTALQVRAITIGTGAGTTTRQCFLVAMSEPDYVGNNLIEWTESYADVPFPRDDPGSTVYTQQFFFRIENFDLSTTYEIGENTDTFNAVTRHTYFQRGQDPGQLIAPRLVFKANRFYKYGGWRPFLNGEEVLSEDSKTERYLGDIFVRKAIYIRWVIPVEAQAQAGGAI